MSTSLQPVTAETRIVELLNNIAEFQRPCKACSASLFFVRHRNGHIAPYTADGVNHFIHCPEARRFKKGSSASAQTA